jgi:hypothetical protein
MLDPAEKLREAYFTALNGNLTDLASANVPLYDRVPSNVGNKYVYVSDYTVNDSLTDKQEFGFECTITLVAVCKYNGDTGGKKEADRIAEQITTLIRTRSYLDLGSEFNMITAQLDASNTFEKQLNGGYEVSRVLKFRHLVAEI